MNDNFNKAVKLMASDKDVIALVDSIESSIKTTQGHYGRYMSVLSGIADPSARSILAAAMILAGADKSGVNAALSII